MHDQPTLGPNYTSTVNSKSVSLSWVLFDFGSCSAALDSARMPLAAARASQDAALQTVFADAAKSYYDAQKPRSAHSTRRVRTSD